VKKPQKTLLFVGFFTKVVDQRLKTAYNTYMLSKKELGMQVVQSFGMFSEEGNRAIEGIIEYHSYHKSPWSLVQQNLRDLADSDYEKFGEAMDTAVREIVYEAIGAYDRGEDFYC
jgi:hypothetical protein